MSRWTKTGSATITPEPMPRISDDEDRNVRGYERIRAKATFPEPVSSKAEAYAARQVRLAKRRGECPRCGALTGQRCWDLGLLPTRAYAPGFHRGRKILPPPDISVKPMTRLTRASTLCRCGHTAGVHRAREGKCTECRCRRLKETP